MLSTVSRKDINSSKRECVVSFAHLFSLFLLYSGKCSAEECIHESSTTVSSVILILIHVGQTESSITDPLQIITFSSYLM